VIDDDQQCVARLRERAAETVIALVLAIFLAEVPMPKLRAGMIEGEQITAFEEGIDSLGVGDRRRSGAADVVAVLDLNCRSQLFLPQSLAVFESVARDEAALFRLPVNRRDEEREERPQ
jgi:hypothetical protein